MKQVQSLHFRYLKILLKTLFENDFKDFRIPKDIYLTSLNYDTGKSSIGDKNTIIEALKKILTISIIII